MKSKKISGKEVHKCAMKIIGERTVGRWGRGDGGHG